MENKQVFLAIFAKHVRTADNDFFSYLTTMKKKDGTEVTMQVKFRKKCGAPDGDICPRMICVNTKDMNYNKDEWDTDDGKHIVANTLWISNWTDAGEYNDTSLDDFDI